MSIVGTTEHSGPTMSRRTAGKGSNRSRRARRWSSGPSILGQNKFKKLVRFLGSLDQFFTHKYQIVGMSGGPVLTLTRPAKLFKSRIIVGDADGAEVGQIVQKNVFGKISFNFVVGGQSIGALKAENWRAWNFRIVDNTDTEVARITKTFEGVLKTMFTTADNYVLQMHHPLEDPLRLLAFASAVTIDVALKQDHRGFSPMDLFNG
ncbi:MAG: hypothetical protein ACI81L_001051 [Verrucomicrobiales bacterium]|jgi:uncharacterized protein YxjI